MPLDLVDRMRSFPLFLSAPEEFLLAIGNHLKPQVHGPNENIITEGDDAKAMYWIVRGAVAVTSRDGEAVFAELKAGAFFGEIGVLMKMPRTATIVSRTKCLLLVLKKEDLQNVMPTYPEMEQAIRDEGQERLNLLKKKRQEGGALLKSPKSEHTPRASVPGEVSTGESGMIRDGVVVNSKKRKSPSPGLIDESGQGSAIGSGVVSIRKTLKELPLFSTLPPDVLHFLGLSVQPKLYPPFTDIVRQGAPGNDIFFIVRGEAEVIHQKAQNNFLQASSRSIQSRPRLRAGQYFGEVSSLGLSEGRTATVRSITTVEALIVSGAVLEEFWSMVPAQIKSQVEATARTRYKKKDDEDVEMEDIDPKKGSKSDPPTPSDSLQINMPHVTFTTPSTSTSPIEGSPFRENMGPRDPDPFLSVNMENIRNRRRHSLAPPTVHSESPSPKAAGSRRPSAIDIIPIKVEAPMPSPDVVGMPAKRMKTLTYRPVQWRKVPQLPNDLLVRIFKYLDIGELVKLRRVSTSWRKLVTESPEVCQYVDLSRYNRLVDDENIADCIAPFIGERALVIDLNNCFHITDEGFATLWKTCGKNVRRWRMRSVWDISANQILEMCENAKSLEEVDWSNCRKVGDNLLGRVVGWIVPEPAPNKLSLALTQKDKKNPPKKVSQNQPAPGTVIGCPKLNTLNLSYCKHVTDRSMAHLAAHAASRIRSLSLTRCTSITDAGFQSWAQFKFEKLTELCLADCTYLSDNAIVALANSAKNLTSLDLSFCCALSDTATEVVALGLPKLRELRLAFCGSAVSDNSLESIALHLTELVGLSVRGCVRVTGRGVDNVLNGCTQLDWLDVSQCRNLEGWLISGGVSRWGFDSKAPEDERLAWATSRANMDDELHSPKAMSVAMLLGRRRRPVKFIIEKGMEGLR